MREGQEELTKLLNMAMWAVMVVCIVAVFVVAIRMAMVYRNGDAEGELINLGWVLGAAILAAGSSGIVNSLI